MRNCQAIRILAWLFIARNLIKSYEKARFLEKSPVFWKAFAFLLTVTYTKIVRKRTAQVSGHKERFMRKKIFVTVLALSLVVAAGSSTVFAQTTNVSKNFASSTFSPKVYFRVLLNPYGDSTTGCSASGTQADYQI